MTRRHLRSLAGACLAAASLLILACEGEDRPTIDVIDASGRTIPTATPGGASGGAAGASVSASEIVSDPGTYHIAVTNVTSYYGIALDRQELLGLMTGTIDWAAATALFESGKNQTLGEGTVRSLAALSTPEVLSVYPQGRSVLGDDFINALVRNGLQPGAATSLSDAARAAIVDAGVQWLIAAKTLQLFDSAVARITPGGAPPIAPMDEAFATLAGPPDANNAHTLSLLGVGAQLESRFGLLAKVVKPLEASLVEGLTGAQNGDAERARQGRADAQRYINAIFYLGVLNATVEAQNATDQATREAALAEAWALWQPLRVQVAPADANVATTIQQTLSRSPAEAFLASNTAQVFSTLASDQVVRALGLPDDVVRTQP